MTHHTIRHFVRLSLMLTLLTLGCTTAFAQQNTAGTLPKGTLGDTKPGSILFFTKYTSNASAPQQSDTQLNITNTNQNLDTSLHLFAIDGSSCSVADSFINLTPNQTASLLMSDFDPGVTGYLIAVAVAGGPTQFNFLIGDEYIRENDGRVANLAAIAVCKVSAGSVVPGNFGAELIFDGNEYERLPATVAVSSFNSQATDNTQVNMFVPHPNLITGEAPSQTSVFTLVYDDAERVVSTTVRVVCYTTFNLSSLRIAGAGGSINNFVPAGRTGWIRFSSTGRPLLGNQINRGPIFNGGHNLHTLTLLASYTMVVPSF